MENAAAEVLALEALGWLASHEELCPIFLGSTGLEAGELRARASDPVFLASVLEFLTLDDAWVVAFCDAHERAYEAPMRARMVLSGAGVAPEDGWA